MNIAVFSDSHGSTAKMHAAVSERPSLNYIIHLGDLLRDALSLKARFPSLPVAFVAGNNDFSGGADSLEKEIVVGGKRFFLCHGHTRALGISPEALRLLANEKRGCDFILFGHTHRAFERVVGGVYCINPGSISLPRDGTAGSFAVIGLEAGGKTRVDIIRK